MESPSPACLDGGFFFPSSPLFGAQQHHNQLDSPHSGSDADAPEHDFVADMLFVQQPPVMHLQQQHQHQHKNNAAGQFHNQLMTEPQFQQHQQHQHFDWHQSSESALPIQLPSLHHLEQQQQQLPQHPPQLPHDVHSYSSGRSSSGSSGHSTPTLVASTSPTHDQVQQQYPQHHPQHEHSSSTASVSSGASASSAAPPSLLDQLSCTIPAASMDGLFAPGTSGSATKPKRKSAKTEKAPSANGSVATLSPQPSQQQHHLQQQHQHHHSLPVFVGASAPLHMESLSVPHHLTVPMHSSSSYASSPSSLSPRAYSPCPSSNSPNGGGGMLVENNEPHPLDDEETKKRKLARKAELARLSRKRKKTRLTDLEAEVRRLEDELARAKKSRFDRDQAAAAAEAGAATSSAATDSLSKHKMSQVISAMSAAVHSGLARCTSANTPTNQRGPVLTGSDASRGQPSALTPLIEEFMVQYNSQAANCSQHLATLQEHHLKPLRTFDFLAALMKQPHDCPTSSPWSQLVQAELQIAPTSREFGELEGFRQSSGSQHNFDQEIERAFVKLSTLFQKRATQHGKNLNRIRSIFSEEQFVKYIEWSHRNGAAQAHQAQQAQAQNQSHSQAHHHHQAHYHQQQPQQSQQYAYAPMYDSPMHGHPQSHRSMSAPMHQQQHASHHLAIKLE